MSTIQVGDLNLTVLNHILSCLDVEGSVNVIRLPGYEPLVQTMHQLELIIIAAHEARVRKDSR